MTSLRLLAALALTATATVLAFDPLKPTAPRQFNNRQEDTGEPVYLTPYYESGDFAGAREAARVVEPLPDVGNLVQDSYAAFITVDEPNDGQTFFWFFPATEVDPATAPVVVWLQGGPGATSMFGLFEIHGPISVEYDASNVARGYQREFAWTRAANMLYIDNPLGAGYSHVDSEALRTEIAQVNDDLYFFFEQFFTIFSDYADNPFFIFGESYAGKWVPEISRKIHQENANNPAVYMNLVGAGVGDGFFSPVDTAVHADYLYQLSLVDEKQRQALKAVEDDIKTNAANNQWEEATDNWSREQAMYTSYMGCNYVYEATMCNLDPEEDNYEEYVQLPETRLAIHVGDTPFGVESGLVFDRMRGDFMKSAQEAVEYVLNNMPFLIYNGNFDIICDHSGILNMFAKMETWTGIDAYYATDRTVVNGDGLDTAGYLKSVQNLRMYVMRNAGHMVPRSQPSYAYDMFTKFINGQL